MPGVGGELYFFLTCKDALQAVEKLPCDLELVFWQCGMFESAERPAYRKASDLPYFGVAEFGESIRERAFLAKMAPNTVVVDVVPQRKGGVRYGVSQLNNPGSVVVKFGGEFDDAVVGGSVTTVYNDAESKALMSHFRRAVRKVCKLINSWYVGPEAETFLRAGKRLTQSVGAPRGYDLSLPESS